MYRESINQTSANKAILSINKGKIDLIVLKQMMQKLHVTLLTLESTVNQAHPLLYSLEERHHRKHRIAIYQPIEILVSTSLYFVGFVSGKRRDVDPNLAEQLDRADRAMLSEITAVPGLLSYSSLELHAGIWYNLVVLHSSTTKSYFEQMETHRYAAYQLAPAYYAWIRLHYGIMPAGLTGAEMQLQRSRYHTFQRIPDTTS